MKATKKYTFIADLTNCETAEDVKFEFIRAKATSGVAVTDADITFILNPGAKTALEVIDDTIASAKVSVYKLTDSELAEEIGNLWIKCLEDFKTPVKKDPWYKRFWRWITKPFRKK